MGRLFGAVGIVDVRSYGIMKESGTLHVQGTRLNCMVCVLCGGAGAGRQTHQ